MIHYVTNFTEEGEKPFSSHCSNEDITFTIKVCQTLTYWFSLLVHFYCII